MRDQGMGSVKFENMNISLKLTPFNQDGRLQFELWDSLIEVEDYKFKLQGSSNFSQAVELTLNKLKDMFKDELLNILARKASKSLEIALNRGMDSNLLMRPLGSGSNILLNCTLTQAPVLTKQYLALPFDGNVVEKGVKQDKERHKPNDMLPVFNQNGKQIQVFLSEQMINSALNTYHKRNMLIFQNEI